MDDIARSIIKANDKVENLRSGDANKNIYLKEYADGSREFIRPGDGKGKKETVYVEGSSKIDVLDEDPINFVNGQMWVRRDLL